MKIHLIDGTFELFRAFFGAPSASAPKESPLAGTEVGATRAFMRSMVALLGRPDVTHVGVAFDTVIESFRNQMFEGYKTGAGIEPSLLVQFPLVEEAADALGLTVWRMRDFEADDALASAAERVAKDPRVERVTLCSPDKDLTQCVRGERVITWDRIRDKTLDEDGVIAKFGVRPESIPDYLGLVGDSADGIPGLPRWGAKSTSTVLARYLHIEDIPDGHLAWEVKVRGAANLAKILRENREDAALYRDLAVLRVDVPMTESPAGLVDELTWRGAKRAALEQVCARLGERAILRRVTRWRG